MDKETQNEHILPPAPTRSPTLEEQLKAATQILRERREYLLAESNTIHAKLEENLRAINDVERAIRSAAKERAK